MDIGTIDPEVIRQATQYLKPGEIIIACKNNKTINKALCKDDRFWEYLFRRDFSEYVKSDDYESEYKFATRRLDRNIGNRYAAINGLEKALREPLDKNKIMARAALGGQLHLVKEMLHLGAKNYNEALLNAVIRGHMNVIKLLLDKGANNYNKALLEAIAGEHMDIVQLMLDKGANNYNKAIKYAEGNQDIIEIINIYKRGKIRL